MKRFLKEVSTFFSRSFLRLGIGSILWLLLRSGTKPGRLRHPRRRAAAGTGSRWLRAFVFPGVRRGLRAIGLNPPEVRVFRPAGTCSSPRDSQPWSSSSPAAPARRGFRHSGYFVML